MLGLRFSHRPSEVCCEGVREPSRDRFVIISLNACMHAFALTSSRTLSVFVGPARPRPKVSLADQLNSVEKLSRPLYVDP